MSDETTPANGREKRWRRWLLVISVGLNLLVLGLVIGMVLRGAPLGGPGGRVDLTVGPLLRALEDDDRSAIRSGLRRAHPFDRDTRIAMRGDMDEMLAVLQAEQFDGSALRGIMERQYNRLQTVQIAVADQFIAHVAGMTTAERLALAERFEAELDRTLPSRPHGRD